MVRWEYRLIDSLQDVYFHWGHSYRLSAVQEYLPDDYFRKRGLVSAQKSVYERLPIGVQTRATLAMHHGTSWLLHFQLLSHISPDNYSHYHYQHQFVLDESPGALLFLGTSLYDGTGSHDYLLRLCCRNNGVRSEGRK